MLQELRFLPVILLFIHKAIRQRNILLAKMDEWKCMSVLIFYVNMFFLLENRSCWLSSDTEYNKYKEIKSLLQTCIPNLIDDEN